MAINEVAGNIQVKVGTVVNVNRWLDDNPKREVLDIKFSCDTENDMVCVVYRKEQIA